jgi:hypothetical protein
MFLLPSQVCASQRPADPGHDRQALAEMAIPGYQGWVKEVDERLSDPGLKYQA